MTVFTTTKEYKALRDKLTALFPQKTIQIKDIKNITKPSFYLRYVTGRKAGNVIRETVESFEVIYFAEDFKLLELLQIKEILESLLDEPIPCENKFIEISEMTINLNEDEYYLQASFDIEITEKINKSDTTALMEKIRIDGTNYE